MDSRLLEWRTALPPGLQVDSDLVGSRPETQSVAAMLLHCMYYNILLVIHRAALIGSVQVKQNANMRIASADTVCLNAARTLARMMNSLADNPSSWSIIR
jgi:cytochrome b561